MKFLKSLGRGIIKTFKLIFLGLWRAIKYIAKALFKFAGTIVGKVLSVVIVIAIIVLFIKFGIPYLFWGNYEFG